MVKTLLLISVLLLFGCGAEPPLVRTYEEEAENPGQPQDPFYEIGAPYYPTPVDAGPTHDAGIDSGVGVDAGRWADCERHRKARGHGKGLERSCR